MRPQWITNLSSRFWPRTRSLFPSVALLGVTVVLPGLDLDAQVFTRGNSNQDDNLDLSDAIAIFNFLFLGGDDVTCLDAGDTNDDGAIDISDGSFLLNFLFLGGAVPPPPSPGSCPGVDPTADTLDCADGAPGSQNAPTVELSVVRANAPRVRQRSRVQLPRTNDGSFILEAGESFTLLVAAESNLLTREGFSLQITGEPAGNPNALFVTCDRDLGDPTNGGIAAGTNLAPLFFSNLDGWSDPLYLLEHAALRIDGRSHLAPTAGRYVFSARVVDDACSSSATESIAVEVQPSTGAPQLYAWVEDGETPTNEPRPHDPGSGNARAPRDNGFLLVVQSRAGSHLSPDTFTIEATPQFGASDLTETFARDLQTTVSAVRFYRWFAPGEGFPLAGNTEFTFSMETTDGVRGEGSFVLEVPVSFDTEVQAIFNASCSGCHEEPSPSKGLELVALSDPPLTVWRNIVHVFAAGPSITSTAPILVRPYLPESSYLMHKLDGTHLDAGIDGEGLRMPLDAPDGLPVGELRLVRSWILQGAELDDE